MGDVFSAFSDIFGDLFGGVRGPAAGADIETSMELSLQEAATGVTREVRYRRQAGCEECQGSGAAPGTQPEVCPQCRGRGQVVHSQGFLIITTACARCRGEANAHISSARRPGSSRARSASPGAAVRARRSDAGSSSKATSCTSASTARR